MATIKVTQTKSLITESHQLRRVMKALGLGRISSSKVHKDNNCTRGMINKVKHLVKYELASK